MTFVPRQSRRAWLTETAALVGSMMVAPVVKNAFGDEVPPNKRQDVPWLAEVVTPPRMIPPHAPRPASLGVDAAGNRLKTQESWQTPRLQLRKWWLDFLGLNLDEPRPAVKVEVLDVTKEGGILRKHLRYSPHPDWPVEAYLLQPMEKLVKKRPAAVVLHPTVSNSIEEPAGVATKDGPPDGPRALGLHLARAGFVTISPRNFLWPTNHKLDAKNQAERWLKEQPIVNGKRSILGMGKMLYDMLVAIDLLVAMEEADPLRIAAVGHSLGAKEALYAAAFDPRVRSAAASEGGLGIGFSNWHDAWYLGGAVKEAGFAHDHHELLALAAPRPLLFVAGESADGDRGWPLIERGREIYELHDDHPRLGQYNHRQGHPLTAEASRRMIEWTVAYT